MEECKCNDCCEAKQYFSVNWVNVWEDGQIDDGSIGTDRDVGSFEDFLEWVIRPLCRSVGFHPGTIDKYIKETW